MDFVVVLTGWVANKHKLCTHLLQTHALLCKCISTQTQVNTRQNQIWFSLSSIYKPAPKEGVWHLWCVVVCSCMHVCVVNVFPLLSCLNEWPHSGQGSSQITEQNCRQPAAWEVNKCHCNIHGERRGGGHRGNRHCREGKKRGSKKKKKKTYWCWYLGKDRDNRNQQSETTECLKWRPTVKMWLAIDAVHFILQISF